MHEITGVSSGGKQDTSPHRSPPPHVREIFQFLWETLMGKKTHITRDENQSPEQFLGFAFEERRLV